MPWSLCLWILTRPIMPSARNGILVITFQKCGIPKNFFWSEKLWKAGSWAIGGTSIKTSTVTPEDISDRKILGLIMPSSWWFRRTQNITSIGLFYKNRGFYLEGVWLRRFSGGYSQEMSMLRIGVPISQFSCRLILMIMKCKYINLKTLSRYS